MVMVRELDNLNKPTKLHNENPSKIIVLKSLCRPTTKKSRIQLPLLDPAKTEYVSQISYVNRLLLFLFKLSCSLQHVSRIYKLSRSMKVTQPMTLTIHCHDDKACALINYTPDVI